MGGKTLAQRNQSGTVSRFHGDRKAVIPTERRRWRAYVARQLVDRSVLGHVVLFIRIILQSHKSEFSQTSAIIDRQRWIQARARCLDAVGKLLQSFGSDGFHGGDERGQLVLCARRRALQQTKILSAFREANSHSSNS